MGMRAGRGAAVRRARLGRGLVCDRRLGGMVHRLAGACTVVLAVLLPGLRAQVPAPPPPDYLASSGRRTVVNVCSQCHGLEYYITPRSRKAWELTVLRMRDYVADPESAFSDAEAEEIIDYLSRHFGEDSQIDPAEHFAYSPPLPTPPPTPGPSAAPSPDPAVADAEPPSEAGSAPELPEPARVEVTSAVRERLADPPWRPGRGLLRVAEMGGYGAVLCLLGLIGTGSFRRRLGRRFRRLHGALAAALFMCLAAHGTIYLLRYGAPPVLWYWFGALSFLLVAIAELQGIVRKRFGHWFLRVHVVSAAGGLALAVLHWVWACL